MSNKKKSFKNLKCFAETQLILLHSHTRYYYHYSTPVSVFGADRVRHCWRLQIRTLHNPLSKGLISTSHSWNRAVGFPLVRLMTIHLEGAQAIYCLDFASPNQLCLEIGYHMDAWATSIWMNTNQHKLDWCVQWHLMDMIWGKMLKMTSIWNNGEKL